MNVRNVILVMALVFLSSCMSVPKVLQGDFAPISIHQAQQTKVIMKDVRWSGQVIQITNDNEKTCLVIVGSETDKSTRPLRIVGKTGGRFIACKEGFMEPKAFEDRLVTITGTLSSYVQEKIDEYDYNYPVISTDIIYIWKRAKPISYYEPLTMIHASYYFCRFNHRRLCY